VVVVTIAFVQMSISNQNRHVKKLRDEKKNKQTKLTLATAITNGAKMKRGENIDW
jgi:hypothetical protein